jgi:hypothetical protein
VSRRYSDTARVIEAGLELAARLAGAVGEAIPEEARRHLANAQRELLAAAFVIYRQQATGRREEIVRRPRPPVRRRRPASPRSGKIPIE